MSTPPELEDLKRALILALEKNPPAKVRELVDSILRIEGDDAGRILPCPICNKQMSKSSRQPLSTTLVKCSECNYSALQYSGVCRTTRANDLFSGSSNSKITIRAYDLDSRERLIVVPLSSDHARKIELKSKDKFELLVAKPGLSEKKSKSVLINKTIGKTFQLDFPYDSEPIFEQFKKTR